MSADLMAGLADRANRLHANATRTGACHVNGTRYLLTFTQGVYEVTTPTGEYVVRFNTRKINQAKEWLREYLAD